MIITNNGDTTQVLYSECLKAAAAEQ